MNIVINGGSKGIGKETALSLSSSAGDTIIITGRDTGILRKISENAPHNNIIPLYLDLELIEDQAERVLNEISVHFNQVDILINNSGMLIPSDFLSTSLTEARRMMEVNFLSAAFLIRLLTPLMRKGSHIVNISSMGGFQGSVKFRGLSYYSSSKAALACMTECLEVELRELGIAVNCLALGAVQTEMLEKAFPGYKAPVSAKEMGDFIAGFAKSGSRLFNGKIIPVALGNPD